MNGCPQRRACVPRENPSLQMLPAAARASYPRAAAGTPTFEGVVFVAAKSEDRLTLLKRMHDRVESAVFDESTPPRDLAALTRRLMEIAKEIETIELQRTQAGQTSSEVPADEMFDGEDV
ncbi:hypothetical protein SEA_ALLEYCAT_5 [Mycobacterium phage AlleyCat]|uniref:Uncharacterized protein n=2 Tax=Kratiovirus larva TaxID=1056831 RepID=A0A221J740_9CAUD|nr:hypothetical protein SEA_ALLEYCAT_5 [Mycobacterium phage AlleyCat]QQV92610.1 terminase small subunit [Mycobacterium phage Psycho]